MSVRDLDTQAAIKTASQHLARLAVGVVSWNQGGDVDPKKERAAAIAVVKAIADDPDTPPDITALLRSIIPALERTQPAKWPQGHSAVEWGERNNLIIETIELVCQTYELDPTRNIATKDLSNKPCGCSIVSDALARLDIELGEETITRIWKTRPKP